MPLHSALKDVLIHDLGGQYDAYLEALAERWGLGLTDLKCLDVVAHAETQVTAGALGEALRLSSGAVTQIVARLEKGGWLAREKHPDDKRQVVITIAAARRLELREALEPLAAVFGQVTHGLSADEVAKFRALGSELASALRREVQRVRSQGAPVDDRELRLPREKEEALDLVIKGGVSHVELGPADAPLLLRALGKYRPRLRQDANGLTLDHLVGGFRLFRGAPARLELSREVRWRLLVKGGAAGLEGDLSEVPLSGLELTGGVYEVQFRLPPPKGTVPVKISGGAHELKLVRSGPAPVRLHLRGGAHGLAVDSLQLGSVGGELKWQSPEYDAAADRYDVELSGGAHKFALV